MNKEIEQKERLVVNSAKVVRLSEHPNLTPELSQIYFLSWNQEGLCNSLDDAESKINLLDPRQAFVLIDQNGKALAAIHTLYSDSQNIYQLCRQFPSYQSVEAASSKREDITCKNFRICFSLIALPGYRIQSPEMIKDTSLSQYLIKNLPSEPETYRVAYSRHPAVKLHEHFGAIPIAILEHSRPEDKLSCGQNVIMVYPKNDYQKEMFEAAKRSRILQPPRSERICNATIFLDIKL